MKAKKPFPIVFPIHQNTFLQKIGTITTFICLSFLWSSYNSQEHKIIADVGVSRVKIPNVIQFPAGVKISTDFNYLADWQSAKMLAVGFKTNNQGDYNKWLSGVQDNCYWYYYAQSSYNKNNYIENASFFPNKLLNIDAFVGNQKATFSFGDLVAIYGDYRRTVFSDGNADCYLSDDDRTDLKFSGNGSYSSYCPKTTTMEDYMHKIAFGLVPPYGKYGNAGSNSVGDDVYNEAGWWGDEMLRIADVNENHFSNVAIAWYIGMHRLALMAVQKAKTDPKYWKLALHCEANALHSLTDLFALGHAVTNRDESSFGATKNDGLQNKQPYSWMESVIKMGGGVRANNGVLNLTNDMAQFSENLANRNDFMPSYLGSWAFWGVNEHDFHDMFNETGGLVRNFNGDRFQVYGDGKLHELDLPSRRVIENAVTASLQTLFDYAIAGNNGNTVTDKAHFEALKYVPVFIEKSGNGFFAGQWIAYASAVKSITGLGGMPANWENCKIPFLSGQFNPMALNLIVLGKGGKACTNF